MWNRHYVIIFVGQLISLLANNVLFFSLSIHILQLTGSATLFGAFTAISVVPTVLLMPFGGVLVDRVDKKKMMIIVDLFLGVTILLLVFLNILSKIIYIIILLSLLSVIELLYTPCVQASIVLIQKKEDLIKSNAWSSQVAFMTNILGPVIGGFLYSFSGLNVICVVCSLLFVLSGAMELSLKIPKVCQKFDDTIDKNALIIMFSDIKEALNFLTEDRIILHLIFVSTVINFTIVPFVVLGLPYIVTVILQMPTKVYGIVSAMLTSASLLGGFLATKIGEKITSSHLFYIALIMGTSILPMAAGFIFFNNEMIILCVVTLSLMVEQFLSNIFTIVENSMFQMRIPNHLLGKVMSFIIMFAIIGDPLCRLIYGPLFEISKNNMFILITISSSVALIYIFHNQKYFKQLNLTKDKEKYD